MSWYELCLAACNQDALHSSLLTAACQWSQFSFVLMQVGFALSCLVCIVHELPRFCTAWQTITVQKSGLQNIQCDNLQIPHCHFKLTDVTFAQAYL